MKATLTTEREPGDLSDDDLDKVFRVAAREINRLFEDLFSWPPMRNQGAIIYGA